MNFNSIGVEPMSVSEADQIFAFIFILLSSLALALVIGLITGYPLRKKSRKLAAILPAITSMFVLSIVVRPEGTTELAIVLLACGFSAFIGSYANADNFGRGRYDHGDGTSITYSSDSSDNDSSDSGSDGGGD